ncbi:TIGR03085 family metal-binding protein [Actinoplanes sp. CA-030573]|uniref:TIGR03085 family metal-binding protein n=1 Tax=Actinoplanes sp. CA-030573 TaxID=3239898 RepID=UPI003D92EF62
MFFDAVERASLSDLLTELGPAAPTLIAPWATRDLAAHLILRDRDPLAAPGLVVPGPWARFAGRRQDALAARDFAWLVATLRSGPPPGFFRLGWVRRLPSLNEFYVHHEDVRRANGLGSRTHDAALDDALWRNVRQSAWFLARRVRVGLVLHRAGSGQSVRARRGEPVAALAGPPGELLLHLFGRQQAADVELTGPAEAVAAVRGAHFGM